MVKTKWPPILFFYILASLDRIIRKGHKKYFYPKTGRISNGRDWHKIQSQNRPWFGIRMRTVHGMRVSPEAIPVYHRIPQRFNQLSD